MREIVGRQEYIVGIGKVRCGWLRRKVVEIRNRGESGIGDVARLVYEGGARGVNLSTRSSFGKILHVRNCISFEIPFWWQRKREEDIRSDNLDFITVRRPFMMPIHHHTCCPQSRSEMHECILSSDTLRATFFSISSRIYNSGGWKRTNLVRTTSKDDKVLRFGFS